MYSTRNEQLFPIFSMASKACLALVRLDGQYALEHILPLVWTSGLLSEKLPLGEQESKVYTRAAAFTYRYRDWIYGRRASGLTQLAIGM